MASLRQNLLPVLEKARAIAGTLGFRPYEVWVRTTTYAGTRVGQGASSSTETRLLVGGQNPKVREVKRRDVSSGSNAFVDLEYDIGPMTPQFPGGGIEVATVAPQRGTSPTEVHYVLKGGDLPTSGLLCQKVSSNHDRPLRIMVRVRSVGVAA
jgi:hypothetical protein